MTRNLITIVGLIPALKNTALTTKFSGKMVVKTQASSYLKAENKKASTGAYNTTESANKSSTCGLIVMENLSAGYICSKMMRETYELESIRAEFVCRGGISKASQKSVCENAETNEPAQRGALNAKEQMFYKY